MNFTRKGYRLKAEGALFSLERRKLCFARDDDGKGAHHMGAWYIASMSFGAGTSQEEMTRTLKSWLDFYNDGDLIDQIEDFVAIHLASLIEPGSIQKSKTVGQA